MSGTEHGEVVTADLEDSIALIIEKALTNLEKRGIIIPFCDDHDRADIAEDDDGAEYCAECGAQGFSGELCHLGCDSVGYELAAKIMKLVEKDLASALESLRGMREELREAHECLLLTKGELEAIKNAPPSNEGTNICGHNRYWIGHYGKCMACRAEQAEAQVAAITATSGGARRD